MELERLKIDRGGGAPTARRRKNPWPVRLTVVAVAAGLGWLFRAPLVDRYERLTLPTVVALRATPVSASQTTALAGTSANGYVVAATRAALSADTPGRVVELNVREGSVVEAGFVVARLFDEEFAAAVRGAEAEVAAARTSVERSQREAESAAADLRRLEADIAAAGARLEAARTDVVLFEKDAARAQELFSQGVGGEREVDVARADLQRAEASAATNAALVQSAEAALAQGAARVAAAQAVTSEARARVPVVDAALEQARATLSKTEVRAPFDGIVVLKDAEVGEVVSPNSQGGSSRGSVVTMVDFASLEVQVDLPETSLSKIHVDQPAAVFLDAFSDERLEGVVSRIWPTASRQKSTVEVRVRFIAIDPRVRPDMGARVVFGAPASTATGDDPLVGALLVRETCLRGTGGSRSLFVLDGDRVVERSVKVEPATSGRLRILEGLEPGEMVVQEPSSRLSSGDRVRVD